MKTDEVEEPFGVPLQCSILRTHSVSAIRASHRSMGECGHTFNVFPRSSEQSVHQGISSHPPLQGVWNFCSIKSLFCVAADRRTREIKYVHWDNHSNHFGNCSAWRLQRYRRRPVLRHRLLWWWRTRASGRSPHYPVANGPTVKFQTIAHAEIERPGMNRAFRV